MTGVTLTGFVVKTYPDIRNEINEALVAAFGSGFDTDLDTPQGQLTAVIADSQASLWELGQDIFASFDIRQAKGVRLDQLGEFRRIARKTDESDEAYRARLLAPRNQTQAAIDKLTAAVSVVPGVTKVRVYYNTSGVESRRGQQALTASIIVEGGDDIAVARAINDNLVFGLGLLGNRAQNIDDDGVCRTIRFIRPDIVRIELDVVTDTASSIGSCGGTSVSTVKRLMLDAFAGAYSEPGATVSAEYLKALLLADGTGVQTLTFNGGLKVLQLTSGQLAKLDADDIDVTVSST